MPHELTPSPVLRARRHVWLMEMALVDLETKR